MRIGFNTPWLVKSDGRVVGPYLERQIGDLLREHVLRPIDEVARPCGRWNYLRDEPSFAKMIEEIRLRGLRNLDDTTTKNGDLSDITRTESISQTEPDELTQEITQFPNVSAVGAQDVMFHSIEEPQRASPRSSGESFTHDGDLLVKLRASQATRWVWAVSTMVILLTLGFVVFRQFIAIPIQNKSELDQSTTAGIEALETGDYTRATELFNRAYALDPKDRSIYLYLGILKIQIENQAFRGRQLLEQLRADGNRDLKQVLTGIGLAYLKEGDLKAAEDSFKKSLEIDPLFQYALINLGATAVASADWTKANNHLKVALRDGSHDGAEILLLADVVGHIFEQTKDKTSIEAGIKSLNEFKARNFDYRAETLIAAMYLEIVAGDKSKVYPQIDEFLEMDFSLTENHRHTLFVHRDQIGWTQLSQWCLKATQDLDPSSHVIAMEAVCLLKAGEVAEATRKIDDALAQTPKDPLVLAVAAHVLTETNANERAVVSLEKAIEFDKEGHWLQPLRQKARVCRARGDHDCERDTFKEILVHEPGALQALAGLARIMIEEKNLPEAKKYFGQGLRESESYRPFFAINKTISQAEDREKARGL